MQYNKNQKLAFKKAGITKFECSAQCAAHSGAGFASLFKKPKLKQKARRIRCLVPRCTLLWPTVQTDEPCTHAALAGLLLNLTYASCLLAAPWRHAHFGIGHR